MFTVFNQELMFCQVKKFKHQLSTTEYKYCKNSFVKLVRLKNERERKRKSKATRKTIRRWDLRFAREHFARFKKGRRFVVGETIKYNEIIIDDKVIRIPLLPNCYNLRLLTGDNPIRIPLPIIPEDELNDIRMLNHGPLDSSLLKQNKENGCGTPKSVSFNNTFIATPIPPRPTNDYESMYKEYLKSVQMNGACNNTSATTTTPVKVAVEEDDEEYMPVEVLEEDAPKRKRGRPRGSGRRYASYTVSSPSKKRGWPLGLSRKDYTSVHYLNSVRSPKPAYAAKGRRGRPRKIVAFGFQSIVSDIKTVSLPSDLWSAHVSVTAKQSQVCFTRVVQAVSNTVPVECDRSIKFNGSVQYLVRINNRDVELIAAPETVGSINDLELLLEIVNEIDINDPILEYFDR